MAAAGPRELVHRVARYAVWAAALAAAAGVGYLSVNRGRIAGATWFTTVGIAAVALLVLIHTAGWGPPARRLNLALALASVGVSLGLAELFLAWRASAERLPSRDTRREASAAALGLVIDRRSSLAVVQALRRDQIPAVPLLAHRQTWDAVTRHPSLAPLLAASPVTPMAGVANRMTVYCNEVGSWMHYRSDRWGFRNPPEVEQLRSIDLAAVGDSYVQGFCVPEEEHLIGRLRARYPATINLGLDGNGPLGDLATLIEYLPVLRPRHVLWFYYEGNDLDDLDAERLRPALRKYLDPGYRQGLADRQPEIDRLLIDFFAALEAAQARAPDPRPDRSPDRGGKIPWSSVAKLYRLRQLLGLAAPDSSASPQLPVDLLRQVLVAAQSTVRAWGGQMHMVYLPAQDEFAGRAPRRGVRAREAVLAMTRELKLPVVDVRARFAAARDVDALWRFEGSHYGPEGYRVAAETVLEYLARLDPGQIRAPGR